MGAASSLSFLKIYSYDDTERKFIKIAEIWEQDHRKDPRSHLRQTLVMMKLAAAFIASRTIRKIGKTSALVRCQVSPRAEA